MVDGSRAQRETERVGNPKERSCNGRKPGYIAFKKRSVVRRASDGNRLQPTARIKKRYKTLRKILPEISGLCYAGQASRTLRTSRSLLYVKMLGLMIFKFHPRPARDGAVEIKLDSTPVLAVAGFLAISSLLITGAAHATVMTFTASGVGGDGPESASATITTGLNSLIVSLSSLQANPTAAGQEVSDIELKLSNTPTSASLPSGGTGTFINIASGGAVTPTSQTNTTHWGVDLTAGTITLATAGTGSVGGKPIELIIGPGPYTNANPSITGRNPQIEDTGVFDLTVGGITSSTTVTSAVFSFGTGPDSTLPGVPVPAPLIGRGLLVLLAVCAVLFGGKLLELSKLRRLLRAAIPQAV